MRRGWRLAHRALAQPVLDDRFRRRELEAIVDADELRLGHRRAAVASPRARAIATTSVR